MSKSTLVEGLKLFTLIGLFFLAYHVFLLTVPFLK